MFIVRLLWFLVALNMFIVTFHVFLTIEILWFSQNHPIILFVVKCYPVMFYSCFEIFDSPKIIF